MMPATPVSRIRRTAVEVADAAGDEELGVERPNEPSAAARGPARRRRATGRSGERRDRRARRPGPRASAASARRQERRPGAPGAGRARWPASRRRRRGMPAGRRIVGDGGRQDHAGRAGGEGQPDRVRRLEPAGELQRDRRPRGDAPTDSRLAGSPRRAPSKSTRWTTRAPAATNRATMPPVGRSGRRCRPTPRPIDEARAAVLEVDRRDDEHAAQRASPASRRRWKLIGSEPALSSVSWKSRSEKRSPRRRCSSSRSASRSLPSRYESW